MINRRAMMYGIVGGIALVLFTAGVVIAFDEIPPTHIEEQVPWRFIGTGLIAFACYMVSRWVNRVERLLEKHEAFIERHEGATSHKKSFVDRSDKP